MENLDITQLLESMKDINAWLVLVIAAVIGAFGGFAHHLIAAEDKASPKKYLIVGAVASVAILFIFTPADAIKFISLSLIAGYAGEAVLNALGAKVEAAIAKQEAVQAESKAKDAVETGKQAVVKAQKLNEVVKKLEENMVKSKGQSRLAIYQDLPDLSGDLQSFINKTPDDLNIEISGLSNKLNTLGDSFGNRGV